MHIINLGPRDHDWGRIEVDREAGSADFDLPMELAFHLAGSGGPRDLLFWSDPDSGLVGIHSADLRMAWDRSAIDDVWIVALKPGKGGDGLAGLEFRFTDGKEVPIMAASPWCEEAICWFISRKPDLEQLWSIPISRRDYGRQD